MQKIQDTNLICPAILSQIAATAALDAGSDRCRQQASGLSSVRDLVLHELQQLGDRLEVPHPGGAFYVLARVRTDRTDMQLVTDLICQYGVAVLPGSTFGVTDGCALRIAYGALDGTSIAEGMGRLTKGLRVLC